MLNNFVANHALIYNISPSYLCHVPPPPKDLTPHAKSEWAVLILTSSSNVLILFRMSRVTGLYPYDVDNWTNFEIFKYRPGGVNNSPHTDYSTVAQGLLFLSNTQLGGNFIIPLLGIAVNPQPGSPVVWQNLDRNGDNDPRSVE